MHMLLLLFFFNLKNNHHRNSPREKMCRGFQQKDRDDSLKIRGFNLQLWVSKNESLPDSLTLHYLQPDCRAFFMTTLHRLVNPHSHSQLGVYGSRERVKARRGGLRFEVYLGGEKLLRGTFRKVEVEEEEEEWKLECKCVDVGVVEVTEAEVSVAVEGHPVMSKRVQMVVERRRKYYYNNNNNNNNKKCFKRLEEIPEEEDVEEEEEERECCCCCSSTDHHHHGESDEMGSSGTYNWEEEMEMVVMESEEEEEEGVKWAVDVGIWVVCFGVAYLVSKASSNRLFRQTKLLSLCL